MILDELKIETQKLQTTHTKLLLLNMVFSYNYIVSQYTY